MKLYMIDDVDKLSKTINTRKKLYPGNLKIKWKNAKPTFEKVKGVPVLKILGHEVIYKFEEPYMKKLGEIATRNGGNILNIGYGMGIVDKQIEKYRKKRRLKEHYIIELNKHIAEKARQENRSWIVEEGNWKKVIKKLNSKFDGIVYDAYPLSFSEVQRDGVLFIKKIAKQKLLKENGILTFFVDASGKKLGNNFVKYAQKLGFKVSVELVSVKPIGKTQYCREKTMIAPVLRFISEKGDISKD